MPVYRETTDDKYTELVRLQVEAMTDGALLLNYRHIKSLPAGDNPEWAKALEKEMTERELKK